MSLQDTPRANRLHIGLFGRRNSGKSSLVNALTGQSTALVSAVAGTTTDPVYKSMEIYGIGPCVFIDTAGFDDEGALGELRVARTRRAAERTDIALVVCSPSAGGPGEPVQFAEERRWLDYFASAHTPVLLLLNKIDQLPDGGTAMAAVLQEACGQRPLLVSAADRLGLEAVRQEILRQLPADYGEESITGNLVQDGDTVLLVMPQDIQAPKGRLILPQVQTLRELLDRHCPVMSVTTDQLDAALAALREPPALIITDSQVFRTVYDRKPPASRLTSFSVLFAGCKGDLPFFVQSAQALAVLGASAHILIAEACTHKPLREDIGREKLPRLLRQRLGNDLVLTTVSGPDFPEDLSAYDFIIQCGACMFNRKYVMARVEKARRQGVPMSNYGVVLAWLAGILDQIDLPGAE